MNRPCFAWTLASALSVTCFTCLAVQAAEYCLRPMKESGRQADNVIWCSTPTGWQGWKDEPHYWDGITGQSKELLQGELGMSVSFSEPNCKKGPEWLNCPHLRLETWGRDSRGQPDADAEQWLHSFLRYQIGQRQDAREEPDPSLLKMVPSTLAIPTV